MVVRLGVPNLTLLNSQRYRILQGQALQLQYASNVVATVRAWARIRYDTGEDSLLFIPDAVLASDRVPALCPPSDVARYDGWVTDALVELPLATDSVKRGQVYIRLFMDPFGPVLCSDYCYSTFGQVTLGTYIQSGPGGGDGQLEVATLKADAVPVGSTAIALALSNAIRRYYGFTWYYTSSADVASRTIRMEYRKPMGPVSTGFTPSAVVWTLPDLTLTAGEDGIEFVDRYRSGLFDDGVLTITDQSTNPTPCPILIMEDDQGSFNFIVGSLHANDRDVIYCIRETWVVL